jgi:hypothetical protein
MAIHVRDPGEWNDVLQPYVRLSGDWRMIFEAHVREGGVWKPFYDAGPLKVQWNDTPRLSNTYVAGGVEFTGCNIGPESYHRWVVVCLSMSANVGILTAGSILINGQPAEMVVADRNSGGAPDKHAAIARLRVPYGDTCTVKVLTPSAPSGIGICVFTVSGGEEAIQQIDNGGRITLVGPAKPNVLFAVHTRNGASGTTFPAGVTQVANATEYFMGFSVGYRYLDTGGSFDKDTNTDAGAVGALFI